MTISCWAELAMVSFVTGQVLLVKPFDKGRHALGSRVPCRTLPGDPLLCTRECLGPEFAACLGSRQAACRPDRNLLGAAPAAFRMSRLSAVASS